MKSPVDIDLAKPSNFLRHVIENDLQQGTYAARKWGGSPGDAKHHAQGMQDPAKLRTRFPPEPNGYLPIGHAKSIWLNFELAKKYGGVCHLRFDDTNPEKEEQEFVDSIRDAVKWLGYETYLADRPSAPDTLQPHEYFASDYFDFMYRAAEYLIAAGLAYVDEQTSDEIRATRGDFNSPGSDSPFRARSPDENLTRFRQMRDGQLDDGAAILRAKIDMASSNINMRDPALYRIRRATHHNTGDKWCIYPMYTYAHPIEDALEQITHSIATLEFEDQRPFYDWLLNRLAEGGLIASPHPRQYEFARLNVTHLITSKRKLRQLVEDGHVDGWDDPRMPTLAGLRRRGYTPDALKLFCERSGVTKSGGWIDYASLEAALRDALDPIVPRAMAVLEPVKLVITNWDELMGEGFVDECAAPVNPRDATSGERRFKIGREVWIERTDYEDVQSKGFFRLFPGNKVRLKYGHTIECTGGTRDASGELVRVHATLVPDTKSGTPGADAVKVKGTITWVAVVDALPAEVRLYDRLFVATQPGSKELLDELNKESLVKCSAFVEPTLTAPQIGGAGFQLERLGYFVLDAKVTDDGHLVINRATGMRDHRGK